MLNRNNSEKNRDNLYTDQDIHNKQNFVRNLRLKTKEDKENRGKTDNYTTWENPKNGWMKISSDVCLVEKGF